MNGSSVSPAGRVFIVGYVHTGTTLLRNILGQHSDLLMLKGESHFFEDLQRIRQEFPDLASDCTRSSYIDFLIKLSRLGSKRAAYRRDQHAFDDLDLPPEMHDAICRDITQRIQSGLAPDHASIFTVVMDSLAARLKRTHWVEKTPAHIYHVQHILDVAPKSKFIELVRDPRGALASRKARSDTMWIHSREKAGAYLVQTLVADPVLDSILWRAAVREGTLAAQRHPTSVLRIRYEDLVQAPEATIKSICSFLGIPFNPTMLNVGWANSTTHAGDNRAGGIGDAALSRWTTTLTKSEIAVIQLILRSDMRSLHYIPIKVGAGAFVKVPFLFLLSLFLTTKRVFKRRLPLFQHRWRKKLRLVSGRSKYRVTGSNKAD